MKTNYPKNSTQTIHSYTIGKLSKIFAVLLCGILMTMSIVAQTNTFPGTNTGPIPDGSGGNGGNPVPTYGTPRVINFNVSGMTGPLADIKVDLGLTHTFAGDLDMVLTAPDGTTSLVLASRIGATTATGFGDNSNFGGTYTFTDASGALNIWTVATDEACETNCVIAPGLYRTTQGGGEGQSNPPFETSLNSIFRLLTTDQINGIWTLTIRDGASGDTGTVTSADIILTPPLIVTKTADTNDGVCDSDCSLREAIAAANDVDAIAFSSLFDSPQTITLGGTELIINKSLTIGGPGADKLTISGNNASRVFNISETTAILDMTIRDGNVMGTGDGGGIKVINGGLILSRCIVSHNSANFGGGIEVSSTGSVQARYSTISNNTASEAGGGFLNQGEFFLSQFFWSTVSNNSAKGFGGGIADLNGSTGILYSTISGNTAGNGGGVYAMSGSDIYSGSSIIAKNSTTGIAPDIAGEIDTFSGYNLIGNTEGTTITGPQPSNILNVDPRLAPLGNYGGTTQTHALLPDSPAIDAGKWFPSNPQFDQRFEGIYDFPNIPNIDDGSDIGAFERQPDDFSGNKPIFDFDGDSKTDISIFRPDLGQWWYLRSSDLGNAAFSFGTANDKLVPADYTGDGKTDVAFWRESTGEWFILRSEDSSFYGFPFGTAGDIPAPGDFDGDGIADAAVFRPSSATWFIQRSSDGGTTIQNFGASGDKPTVADFDGDGKDDIAIYRPSNSQWWQLRSTAGTIAYQFGTAGDKTIQGDYTGDGKADVGVFRPSTGQWLILRSEDSSFFGFPFGTSTDIPSPGDYDGDGTFDAAVFRPSNNTWYYVGSTSGNAQIGFGISGDIPIPNVYSVE